MGLRAAGTSGLFCKLLSVLFLSQGTFMLRMLLALGCVCLSSLSVLHSVLQADEPAPRAFLDGTGPGWKTLTLEDFTRVNCDPETFTTKDGMIHCTGQPIGVTRSKEMFTNLEISVEWRHLQSGGNSGMFLWADPAHLEGIPRNSLPKTGIEIQMLDHGYAVNYEKQTGKKGEWFTTNGDIFPVGNSKLKPFEPLSPDGSRSFPRKNLSKGINEWNHYYVRAINGEVRLWVNGEEVSGGTGANPPSGHLCLESEGAPIDFRNLRVRILP